MDLRLLEMCSAAALAGLCASPHHPPGAHPTNGEAGKVATRALLLGKALAEQLEATREEEETAPSPPVVLGVDKGTRKR